MDRVWVGIDVDKEFHWAHVLDASGRELLRLPVFCRPSRPNIPIPSNYNLSSRCTIPFTRTVVFMNPNRLGQSWGLFRHVLQPLPQASTIVTLLLWPVAKKWLH
jgi:hypothetical protein